MRLAIDIGNSRAKVGVFDADGMMVHVSDVDSGFEKTLSDLLLRYNISSAVLGSVADAERSAELASFIRDKVPLLVLDHKTPLPITMEYQSASTLGVDRIAVAVAAHAMFPQQHVLVIQAGTCLVTDFITRDGVYKGGSISPGLNMRFAALQHFTSRLPLVENTPPPHFIGNSTVTSIQSGVFFGVVDEINGTIARYNEQFGDVAVILTGGQKNVLEKSIKSTIFAVQNLVLTGLYKILIFNAESQI